VRALLLLALLLLPGLARAADGDPYARVDSLRVLRAGFLEEGKQGGDDVVLLRGQERVAVTRGMQILEGDVVTTAAGECLLTTEGGWRIGVAEGSELVVRPTFVHRLGEVVYRVRAAMGVQIERVEVLVEGTEFRVVRGAGGVLQLQSGRVRVVGDSEVAVAPGQAVEFGLDGPVAEPRAMTPLERSALARAMRRLTTPGGGDVLRVKRLHLLLGQGASLRQGAGWSSTTLGLQTRLLGPIWVDVDVGLLARPLDLGPDVVASALAIPLSVGPRIAGTLGGRVYGRAGVSLTVLLGDRCVDSQTCERGFVPQPGARLDTAVGLALGPLVVELQGGFGLDRQDFYDADLDDVLQIPAAQILGALAVGVRL
jgi:hypothetical protein